MQEIYTINKGNQYDGQGGYRITNGINWGWGTVEADGVYVAGNCGQRPHGVTDAEWQTVTDAIKATMADGQERIVTIGNMPTLDDLIPVAAPGPGYCPKCGSYCYGDCEVA